MTRVCIASLAFLLLHSAVLGIRTAEEAQYCQLGYSCVTSDSPAATKCLCQTFELLHESKMPYDDKLAMLKALQDKNEDKLVRMRFRQTSRNLLMNLFGTNRNQTDTIAEMKPGTCAAAGFTSVDLKLSTPMPIGGVGLNLAIEAADEKLMKYRQTKIQNVAPAVVQAAQYGEKMSKDIFLQQAIKNCIAGDTTTPEVNFGE